MKSVALKKTQFVFTLLLSFILILPAVPSLAQSEKEPLTLAKAVELALDSNQLVKAARYSVEAADARMKGVSSNYWPKLNYDYSISRGNNPVFVFGSLLTQNRFTLDDFYLPRLNKPDPINNFQSKFSGSMMLFDFFRTRKGVELHKLGKDGSQKELEKTQADLVFRVLKAYQDALLAQEFLKVAEEAVKSAEADQARVEALFQAGLVVESDLLSVKVHKASQAEELIKARNNVKMAYSNLNFEMGFPLDKPYELAGPLKPFSPEPMDLPSCQKIALERRPDYLQAELGAKSGEVAVQASKTDFWPMVSAFGQWETDQSKINSSAGNNYVYGINVHYNLFNGRADQVRLAESRVQQQRAAAMRDYMAQAVRMQVQQAYLDLDSAGGRILVSEQAVAQAEESLRIIRNRYEAGLTTITDLLRAEVASIGAKSNRLRAIFDQRVSAASLELQTGQLSRSSRILTE